MSVCQKFNKDIFWRFVIDIVVPHTYFVVDRETNLRYNLSFFPGLFKCSLLAAQNLAKGLVYTVNHMIHATTHITTICNQ